MKESLLGAHVTDPFAVQVRVGLELGRYVGQPVERSYRRTSHHPCRCMPREPDEGVTRTRQPVLHVAVESAVDGGVPAVT